MLKVGREISIGQKAVACISCRWEGLGGQLSSGLIRIEETEMYLYVYRCPVCDRLDVTCKGKLLEFPIRDSNDQQQIDKTTASTRQSR